MRVERSLFLAIASVLSGCTRPPTPLPSPPLSSTPLPPPPSASPAASAPIRSSAQPPPPAPRASAAEPAADPETALLQSFLGPIMQGGRCRERVVATEGNPHVPATPLERKCLAIDIPYNPDWPACEGVEPGCTHYVEGLRPPLGSRMLACLQAKSGKRAICEHGVVGACVQAAVASTPVREDARVACGRIAAHCGETGKSLDAADCGRLLSSIGECRILGWATSCMVERCEVRGCVDDPW